MPYQVQKQDGEFCVVGPDGKVVKGGRHKTKSEADAHMKALMANVKEATEEDKKAQQARSKKYGIGIKPGGNVTKPADYASVADDDFADPVNYRYPLSPAARAVNAITRFNDSGNKTAGGYTDAEWAKMGQRIAKANQGKMYKGGQVVDKSTKEAKLGDQQSLTDFVSMVRDAFDAKFGKQRPDGTWPHTWCKDVYADKVVAEIDEKMYAIPFSMENGELAFAPFDQWTEVAKTYVPVTEGLRILASKKKSEEAEPEGREWEVIIIGPESASDLVMEGQETFVKSKNGRLYKASALEASVPLWDGIKVYDNHLTDEQFEASQGMRSVVNEWVGVIVQPAWDAVKKTVTGVLKVVDENLRTKLVNAEKAGVLGAIGLSIDALGEGVEKTIAGAMTPVVEKISRALSVDVVADPAAGGRLSRMIAGTSPLQHSQKEDEMDPEEIKKLIEEALGGRLTALKSELQEAIKQLITEAVASLKPADNSQGDQVPAAVTEAIKKAEEMVKAAEEKARLAECATLLGTKLQESGLPDSFRKIVAKAFAGKTFEEKDLDEAIKEQREALSHITESGRVIIPDGANINVSPVSELDRYELAFLRLVAGATRFGEMSTKENAEKWGIGAMQRFVEAGKPQLPRASRLSEWYYQFSEDYDGYGVMRNKRLMEANVTSSALASIVKNTVNLLLANDYSQRYQWWAPIVRQEDVDSLDTATLVRVFGISNLATMSEGDAYAEAAWADEEETASYVKRGNFIGVTLETFLLDKLNTLRSLPTRLSNAWYNTVSALVSAVFTVNTAAGPVLADSGALFNATAATSAGGHANLLTTALSYAAYDAVYTAMLKQTDQVLGAGKKLMATPRYLLVPVDLRATANQIRNTENVPGSANYQANPYGPNGGPDRPEVIVVPEWTDTNNWACVADPAQFPAIWLIWLRGRRTPELFSAEDERGGAMFTNDTLRFKVRQYGFRYSATYDCAPVSDFRPLHKSNVA